MSIIEVKEELTTEITSEVDVMVDVLPSGIGFSIYIDDELFSDDVSWEDMASNMLYDIREGVIETDEVEDIIGGLTYILDELKNGK